MMISEEIIRESLLISEGSRDSYVLYGSFARGDYEELSDIDVLRITTKRMPAQRLNEHALLHIYDIKDLLQMARQGDLFILHLLREAKPIYDPCRYLEGLSAAFRKPESYTADAQRRVAFASALLDVKESLFETAPQRFMDVAVFLCRTLVYAEHADRGPFSFSLRELAAQDDTALMVTNIRHQPASYSDFQRIRQAVRSKLNGTAAYSEAASTEELSQRSSNPLFVSLLRRIVAEPHGDPYLLAARLR